MNESINFSNAEKERPYVRMPITVETDGGPMNIWSRYQLGHDVIIADCNKCGKKDQELEIQKPENIEVETDDAEIKRVVLEKLLYLVRTIEEKMSVCGECFDDEFLAKRTELYIATLEEIQRKMGINIDTEEQRKNILAT